MSAARQFVTGLLLACASLAGADASLVWINRNVFKQIQLTGRRVLGYHLQSYEGDAEAYQTLTYYGQGGQTFTDYGQMNVVGRRVLGVLNFQMQLQNDRFGDPQGQKISLNYAKGPVSVDLGDIQGSLLNTNQFASFNKSLKGVSTGLHYGRARLRAVRSDVRGSVRTISIPGNGSQGPYYLNASQIIPDSERIMVDGVIMKIGVDYAINDDVGSITFLTKPISQTSTIVASYETYSYNANTGTIQGVGATYDFGRFGRLGVTTIQQNVGGNRSLSPRTDLFQGFGAPSTPYYLQFLPLTGYPIIVKVDGILQVEGVDYVFDKGNPSIFYFQRFMPATSNIDVTYTPQPTQAVNGNREVSGFDYTLPLGKGGKLGDFNFSQATGKLKDALTPLSGTARGLTTYLHFKGLNFRGSVRDVPAGYVGIETIGFNRNEKAVNLALDSSKGPLHYGVSTQNSLVSTSTDDGKGNVIFNRGRVTYTRAFATLDQHEGSWSLEQSRSTSDGASGNTKIDSSTLSNTRHIGKLGLSFGLQRVSALGPVATDAGTVLSRVSSDSLQLRTDYDAGRSLSLAARTSLSSITSSGETGRGTDTSLSASYHPVGRFSADASYILSRSGQIAALSQFQNGLGYGYGGNGFSGTPTGTPFGNSGTDVEAFQVFSTLRLTRRANLESHFVRSQTSGDVSSNSRTVAFGGGLQLDLGNTNSMNLSLDRSLTSYLGSTGSSAASTFNAFISGAPIKRWTYHLGTSVLLSDGSQYAQNQVSFDGALTRRIASNQTLSFQFQTGRTSGYLPQDDGFVGLFHSYQLYRNVAIVTSYKVRRLINLDPTQQTGWYRSNGFDIELTFDFGR